SSSRSSTSPSGSVPSSSSIVMTYAPRISVSLMWPASWEESLDGERALRVVLEDAVDVGVAQALSRHHRRHVVDDVVVALTAVAREPRLGVDVERREHLVEVPLLGQRQDLLDADGVVRHVDVGHGVVARLEAEQVQLEVAAGPREAQVVLGVEDGAV